MLSEWYTCPVRSCIIEPGEMCAEPVEVVRGVSSRLELLERHMDLHDSRNMTCFKKPSLPSSHTAVHPLADCICMREEQLEHHPHTTNMRSHKKVKEVILLSLFHHPQLTLSSPQDPQKNVGHLPLCRSLLTVCGLTHQQEPAKQVKSKSLGPWWGFKSCEVCESRIPPAE